MRAGLKLRWMRVTMVSRIPASTKWLSFFSALPYPALPTDETPDQKITEKTSTMPSAFRLSIVNARHGKHGHLPNNVCIDRWNKGDIWLSLYNMFQTRNNPPYFIPSLRHAISTKVVVSQLSKRLRLLLRTVSEIRLGSVKQWMNRLAYLPSTNLSRRRSRLGSTR
ncbi:hypothetical protein AX17_003091 [Amanita inopinata Kibby_2008]|nr:hypothetical protein AX17_003091 [Amanita inopinata Kibby_2008]